MPEACQKEKMTKLIFSYLINKELILIVNNDDCRYRPYFLSLNIELYLLG